MGRLFARAAITRTPRTVAGEPRAGVGRVRSRLTRLQIFWALALGLCALVPATAAASGGGAISGKVTAATGKTAIEGIQVCVESATAEYSSRSCSDTNSSGEYTVGNLSSGSYKVEFENENCSSYPCSTLNYIPQYWQDASTWAAATPVPVTAPTTTTGIDAELATGATIEGTVVAASNKAAIESLRVCAFEAAREGAYHCSSTNTKGEYAIVGLASESYDVYFENVDCAKVEFECATLDYIAQYWEHVTKRAEAKPVPVTAPGAVKAIDAELKSGGTFKGTVTAASGGAPIEGVSVCARPDQEGLESGPCARTNKAGTYELQGLETGKYLVSFSGGEVCGETGLCHQLNYVGQFYPGAASTGTATPIQAEEGKEHPGGINASMATGGQIKGTVTTAPNGTPIEGITVCAESGAGPEFGDCAQTLADGEYTLVGLNGRYTIEFQGESACGEHGCEALPYVTEFYNGEFSYEHASSVTVNAPETLAGINERLVKSSKQAEEEAASAAAAKKHEEEVAVAAAAKKHEEEVAAVAAAKKHAEEVAAVAAAKKDAEEVAAAAATRKHDEASASIEVVRVKVTATSVLITVKVARAGTATVTGQGLKKTSVHVAAGTHTIKIALTRVGKSEREHRKKIKIAVSVRVGSRTVSSSKEVKL